ncbi:hypothetical protein V6N11_012281 [Hibiscus sabdariffa]|uniref:Uncharacterized protein n=1 Tax=Hibiscus sabdariffa TaxID=183260 RepID=A0ABR2QB20_9ROSI
MLSCKTIQKAFMDRILMDPKMKVATLKEMCQTKLGAYAPYNMCQRARRAVLKEMHGSYVEEFATLWGYAAELLHSNPGSTVTIQAAPSTFSQLQMLLRKPMHVWKLTTWRRPRMEKDSRRRDEANVINQLHASNHVISPLMDYLTEANNLL